MGDLLVLNSALGVGKFWPELSSQFLVNVNSTRNEQMKNSKININNNYYDLCDY